MPRLGISPSIIPNIATLYSDVNRIFMEYIDNSLDSAEEFFDEETNSYKKDIYITIEIDGDKWTNGKVIIKDNSKGISDLNKLITDVGNSNKKEQAWTNGQFGFGIYSFLAACKKIEFTSKIPDGEAFNIKINKKIFETHDMNDVSVKDAELSSFEYNSGTSVILSGFEKHSWKEVDFYKLKKEIESHFELLLNRKNLSIKIVKNSETFTCEPFNYYKYGGECYEGDIYEIQLPETKVFDLKKQKLNSPIKVFLYVTKDRILDRFPIVASKGRRIGFIKDIKKFVSKNKQTVWRHPNLTGYIEVGDLLNPTIARTDFRNTRETKGVFKLFLEIEDLILEIIKTVNNEAEKRHYKGLENVLNDVLSNLSKEDRLKYRTDIQTGNQVKSKIGDTGAGLVDGDGGKDYGDGKNSLTEGSSIGIGDGDGLGPSDDKPGKYMGDNEEGSGPAKNDIEDPFDDDFSGNKRKSSGFNILIDTNSEPQKDLEGNMKRSKFDGSHIRIFGKHPDFEARVGIKRTGEKYITHSLITYLAGEITVHYKDKLNEKQGQETYNIKMFEGVVDFIYKFELALAKLEKQNLSSIEL